MNEWNWNGARWWKCDFHTHTPASNDYGKGPNQKALQERSPREWLLDYMRAGVDCVAITDHNTGAWIDRVKTALGELESENPEGFRPLHVFPGVEISVSGGVHLLAILAGKTTTSDIDSLLGAVGFPSENKGSSDAVTTKSFVEVIEAIVKAPGIAIPAHVDGESGLFNRQQGTTLDQALNCKDIFAMELVNLEFEKPQLYIDKKLRWTEILGSDAHHPSGNAEQGFPGSHFTWVKMRSPSVEGLRLALMDGALSVRRSDQVDIDPNEHVDSVIEKIEVSNSRYIGRSKHFEQIFNPWLNAVIGGRGTGKSTVVEFLRIALRRDDELPADLRSEFEKYGQIYVGREDGGLLTDNAEIRVTYRKDDSRFRIQWDIAGGLEPIEQEEEEGKWRRTEGDIRHRFPVRIYSQKQVFQLAKTPLALLKIIDDAPEVDYHAWSEKWKMEESYFLSLRTKIREIEAGLGEEPRLRGELDDVERKLAIFERSGHTEILKSFQERSRQYRAVEAWEESWTGTGEQLREVAADIVADQLDESSFDSDSKEDNELRGCVTKVRGRLGEIRKEVEALVSRAENVVSEWFKDRDESSWKENVDAAKRAYQELKKKLVREGADDPAAYGEFVQRRQTIEQRLQELDHRKGEVDKLNKQADAQLRRLLRIRRELTDSRRGFLRNVLRENPYVQIHVLPYGASDTVESEFRRLLQRGDGGFERDIGSPNGQGLLGELYGKGDCSEDVEQNLAGIKDKIRKISLQQYDTEKLADRRFATHIERLAPETLDRLDLWFPKDSLEVQYSATGDGEHFRSIREGSPGQKTAALLAFLLSYGEEPLILDQPEDDLDNLLIYDLIVTQLRDVKLRRQVIVVTHNANIVVNGDAELVVALTARHGETQKECEGSLQEQQVRDTICAVMEGGRKAFEDRYRRIALDGRHV